MFILNLQNIEELIFLDNATHILIPDLRHIFDQWLLSKRVPTLRSLRLRSLMDLLNSLSDEHVRKLENYFGDGLVLDKLDYHIVRNLTLPLDFDANKEFLDCATYGNFAISRNTTNTHVTFWR